MRIEAAAYTHIGRRNNNEDSLCMEPGLGLYAVADGMGGYEGGEVASRIAVEAITDFVRRNAGDDNLTWPYALDRTLDIEENLAKNAARLAHREVFVRKVGPLAQMGSTLSLMTIVRDHAIIAHIGDSRIYRLRAGELQQITHDHSVYAELVRSGAMVPSREDCSFAHMVTRALGMDHEAMPDIIREPLAAGDTFLLCTDGLVEPLSDEELREWLAKDDLHAACRDMVLAAYEAGGRDNITAVVVRALAA